MKIRSKIFSNRDIEKLRKTSRGIGPRNLVSKNQLLSSKIAGSSPRTDRHAHTHTEKTKLRDPFFSAIIFFISMRFRMRITSTCKNKGGLIKIIIFTSELCSGNILISFHLETSKLANVETAKSQNFGWKFQRARFLSSLKDCKWSSQNTIYITASGRRSELVN